MGLLHSLDIKRRFFSLPKPVGQTIHAASRAAQQNAHISLWDQKMILVVFSSGIMSHNRQHMASIGDRRQHHLIMRIRILSSQDHLGLYFVLDGWVTSPGSWLSCSYFFTASLGVVVGVAFGLLCTYKTTGGSCSLFAYLSTFGFFKLTISLFVFTDSIRLSINFDSCHDCLCLVNEHCSFPFPGLRY